MNQDNGIFAIRNALRCAKTVVDGILTRCAAFDDFLDLPDVILHKQFLEVRNPVLDTRNDDGVNIRMILKQFQRMNDDWLAMHAEELFRTFLATHT